MKAGLFAGRQWPVGLLLPGTAGNYVSTPDAASLDITGDLSLIAHIAYLDDSASTRIIVKSDPAGDQRSYGFQTNPNTGLRDHLQLFWSSDGSTVREFSSEVGLFDEGYSVADDLWVAVTFDADNGSGGTDVKFWFSNDGGAWTQLGSTKIFGATSSIYDSSAALTAGALNAGNSTNEVGLYYVALFDGIGANTAPGQGTLVAEATFRQSLWPGDTYLDATGKTWTINGSGSSWGL